MGHLGRWGFGECASKPRRARSDQREFLAAACYVHHLVRIPKPQHQLAPCFTALYAKMGTMPIRLIAVDIDGTLLNSRLSVSEGNRAAVAEATRRGIEVALVTGRRYDFALPVAQQIDSPLTMIVNNGALIRTKDGETRLRHLLPRETALRVLQATQPWRSGASVVFDRHQ